MNNSSVLRCLAASILLLSTIGCASAYRCYSGCHVPCRYCAPAPLPYTQYDGCVCHSHAVSKNLTIEPQAAEFPADSADNNESAN